MSDTLQRLLQNSDLSSMESVPLALRVSWCEFVDLFFAQKNDPRIHTKWRGSSERLVMFSCLRSLMREMVGTVKKEADHQAPERKEVRYRERYW